MSRSRGVRAVAVVVLAAGVWGGCGGDDEGDVPEPASAEEAVSTFLDEVKAQDTVGACSVITEEAQEAFAERLGQTQTSTELTSTICVENLGTAEEEISALEYDPEFTVGEVIQESDFGLDTVGTTPVEVEVTLGEQTSDFRFLVREEPEEGWTIILLDE